MEVPPSASPLRPPQPGDSEQRAIAIADRADHPRDLEPVQFAGPPVKDLDPLAAGNGALVDPPG